MEGIKLSVKPLHWVTALPGTGDKETSSFCDITSTPGPCEIYSRVEEAWCLLDCFSPKIHFWLSVKMPEIQKNQKIGLSSFHHTSLYLKEGISGIFLSSESLYA